MPRRDRPAARLNLVRLEDRTTPVVLLDFDGTTLSLTESGAAAADTITVSRDANGLQIDLGAANFKVGSFNDANFNYNGPGDDPTKSTSVVAKTATITGKNLTINTGSGPGDTVTIGADDLALGAVTITGTSVGGVTFNKLSAASVGVSNTLQITVAGSNDLAATGAISLAASNTVTVSAGATVTAGTTLDVTAGTLSAAGSMTATGNATLTATTVSVAGVTSSNGKLDIDGAITATGTLSGKTLVEITGASVSAQAVSGPLSAVVTGAATFAGTITSTGGVTVQGSGVDLAGVTASGTISAKATGGGTVTASGTLDGTTGVQLDGGTMETAGVLGGPLTLANGSVNLTGLVKSSSVTATMPALSTFKAAGGIDTTGDVTVSGSATSADFASFTAGGALTVDAGTITGTVNITANGGAKLTATTITLQAVAASAGKIESNGKLTATGTLSGSTGVSLTGPSIDTKAIGGGPLTITTTGGGDATVGGIVTSSSVTADTTGGTFEATFGINPSGLVSIKAATAMLTTVDADGSLTIDAGTITASGDMIAAGNAKLTGTTITVAGVSSDGSVQVTGNLTASGLLSGATGVTLDGATISTAAIQGGLLKITGGAATLNGLVKNTAVDVDITGVFNAPGGIDTVGGVTAKASGVELFTVSADAAISVTAFAGGSIQAPGTLDGATGVLLTGGTITTVAVTGGSLTISGGDATLGGLVSSSSVNVNITGTFKALLGINTTGGVTVTATDAQFGAVTSGGTLTATTGTISATADMSATGGAKLTGTTISVQGVASSAGKVETTGKLTATGTLNGATGVTLLGPSIDTKAISGGAVTITTTGGGDATVGGLVNAASLTADATGGTFQATFGINPSGLVSIKAATATLATVAAGSTLTIDAGTITASGDMTAVGDAKLTGTTIGVAGVASSAGKVETTGKLTATGTLNGAKGVTLLGPSIDTKAISGGPLTVTTTGGGDATLGGSVTSSSVNATIAGTFKSTVGINTPGGVTVTAANAQVAAVTTSGTVNIDVVGNLVASGPISGANGVTLDGQTVTMAAVAGGALVVTGMDATLGGVVTSASVSATLTGDFKLTGTINTPGTVTVKAQNAAFGATTAGGVVSVTANGFTTLNGVVQGSPVTVLTNTIATNPGGGLKSVGGVVTVAPSVVGRDIQLAGADPGTALWLSSATLNGINAPSVVIGDLTNTNHIVVAGDVNSPGFSTLKLLATGDAKQTTGDITLTNLTVTAADVKLDSATSAVGNITGSAQTGSFEFTAEGPLDVNGVTAAQSVIVRTTAGALAVPAASVIQATNGGITFGSAGNLSVAAGSTVRVLAPGQAIVLQVNGTANVSGAALTASGGVTITGGVGNDTFNLTPSPNSKINVDGGAGTDALNLNNGGAALTHTGNTFSIVGFQDVTYTSVENIALVVSGKVTVTGTNAADTLVLDRTSPTRVRYVLNGGVPVTYDGSTLTFDALAGDDTLQLEFAGGSPLPNVNDAASLIYVGGADTDTLAVVGTAGDDEFDYDPAGPSFRFSGPGVPLTPVIPQQVERLTFDGGGGQDCLDVAAGGQEVEFAPTGIGFAGTVTVGIQSADFANVGGVDVRAAGVVTAKLPAAPGLVALADSTLFCDPAVAALRLGTPSPIPVFSVSGATALLVRPGDAITDVLVGPVSITANVASLTLGVAGTPFQNVQFNGAVQVTNAINVDADGVAFAGPSVQTGGPQTYTTPVAGVVGTTALTATAGAVTFSGTVGVNNPLAINAGGAVTVGGDVTGNAALVVNTPATTTFNGTLTAGSVTTDAGGSTVVNGGLVKTTGGSQMFGDAVSIGANTTFDASGGVTFSNTLSGPGQTVTVLAPGTTLFGGTVNVLSLTTDAGGTTTIGTAAIDTTGDQKFGDTVEVLVNTKLTSAAGAVHFDAVVDGPGGVRVDANTVTFGNTVGVGTKLAFLTANAPATVNGDVRTFGDQAWNGVVTVGADTAFQSAANITFAQSVNGAGSVVGATATGTLTFGGPVTARMLTSTATGIQINGASVTTAPGSQTYTGPVTLGANAVFTAGADVTFNGTLTAATKTAAVNAPGITTFGGVVEVLALSTNAGGTTKINGGSVTTGGNQAFGDATRLGANATLTAGGVVSFASTLDGPGALTATAATVTFANTVGVPTPLAFLIVNAPATVTGDVRTVGDQAWAGVVSVAAETAFTATGNVSFGQALSGAAKALAVTASGTAAFGGPVTAASLAATAAQINVNGGSVATGPGSQTYTGPVMIGANTAFTSGDGITFNGLLTGPTKAATFVANATLTFQQAVSLASVNATATSTAINGGSVTTTGDQSYTGAAALGGALETFAGSSILFNGPVNGPAGMEVTAASLTFINPVGQGTPLAGLTANAPAIVNGGFVGTVADQVWNFPVGFGANTVVQSGGNVTFAATFSSGGSAVSLTAAGAATFMGAVAAGTLSINSGAATAFNSGVSAGPFSVISGGTLTFGAALAAGATSLSAGGAITFTGTVLVAGLNANAPLFAVNGGRIDATAGNIALSGPVVIGTDTTFAAAGAISITTSIDGVADRGQAVQFEAPSGNIALGSLGAAARFRAIHIASAADATIASARGDTLTQLSGTGTTQFSGPVEVGSLQLTTGAVRILSDVTTGDVAFTTGVGGVAQVGGSLSAANLSLTGVGPFDLGRPGNILTGTVRANVSAGDVNLTLASNFTVDPTGGVRVAGGNVTFNTTGAFTVLDPSMQAGSTAATLIDVGNGSLNVTAGGAATFEAVVRVAGGNVGVTAGGNFRVTDTRTDATRYATPLFDLAGGMLTVSAGLAAADKSEYTIDAEVRATSAAFGVPGGGNNNPDVFTIRPSALTPLSFAGNSPTIPLAPGATGDELRVKFIGADVFRFQYDGQDGLYQFKNRQQIVFTGIETLARFGIAAFVVQTGEPNDATGATRQQYAVRMVRTQDGVPLGGGIDGGGLAENPFVVSPVRVSTGTALTPPRITFADVNGDGVQDMILANGPGAPPLVSVIDGLSLDEAVDGTLVRLDSIPASALLAQFFAYDPTFFGGVNLAAGDLDGDGRAEIVTAADNGGGPHVRSFTFAPNGTGGFTAVQFPGRFGSFFAFEPSFRGGARVAVGDFDGDNQPDLIIGAGVGGGPRVQVFDVRTGEEKRTFFAYDDSYRGGVYVDAGDFNNDGTDDVLTAPGAGGAAHIRVFSGKDREADGRPRELAGFFAFDSTGDSDPLLGQFQSRLGVGGIGFGGFSALGSREILVATPRGVPTRVLQFSGLPGTNPTTATDLLADPQFTTDGPDNQPIRPPASQLFYGASVGGFTIDDVGG